MDNSRPVYSTETGRICPECGRPVSQCPCKRNRNRRADKQPPAGHPRDGVIRVQRETKGRKGKTVTVVYGVPLESKALQEFAQKLKRCCGAGGTIKEGVVEIQGDHRQAVLDEIRKQGYTAKITGG